MRRRIFCAYISRRGSCQFAWLEACGFVTGSYIVRSQSTTRASRRQPIILSVPAGILIDFKPVIATRPPIALLLRRKIVRLHYSQCV